MLRYRHSNSSENGVDVFVSGGRFGEGRRERPQDGKHTGVDSAGGGGVKRERSLGGAERSDVRYRQQRDAGDTTSDGERWKVTGGAGRSGRVCGDGVQGWRRAEEEG